MTWPQSPATELKTSTSVFLIPSVVHCPLLYVHSISFLCKMHMARSNWSYCGKQSCAYTYLSTLADQNTTKNPPEQWQVPNGQVLSLEKQKNGLTNGESYLSRKLSLKISKNITFLREHFCVKLLQGHKKFKVN